MNRTKLKSPKHRGFEITADDYPLIDRIPQGDYRRALRVSAYAKNYEDAARRLEIPVGTFRSRLSRGRDALVALRKSPPQDLEPLMGCA